AVGGCSKELLRKLVGELGDDHYDPERNKVSLVPEEQGDHTELNVRQSDRYEDTRHHLPAIPEGCAFIGGVEGEKEGAQHQNDQVRPHFDVEVSRAEHGVKRRTQIGETREPAFQEDGAG